MPEVSVIVTTYNRKEYLKEAIDSILYQTYKDFELIVVDNYSNYDFISFITGFNDNRIRFFQNHNNGIIAANRNVGIKNAIGKFLSFCDDDDIWLPTKLEVQVRNLNVYNSNFSFSNIFIFNDYGFEKKTNYKNINNINQFLLKSQITLSSVTIRNNKEILFNEDNNIVGLEDYELWLRLIQDDPNIDFICTPLVKNRINDSSNSRQSKSNYELTTIKFRLSLLLSRNRYSTYSKIIIFYRIILNCIRYYAFVILRK